MLGTLLCAHVVHPHLTFSLLSFLLSHLITDLSGLLVHLVLSVPFLLLFTLTLTATATSAAAVTPVTSESRLHGSRFRCGGNPGALLSCSLREHSEVLLLAGFLLLRDLLLHESALADLLSGMSISDEKRFGEFGEVVVDVNILEPSTIGGETLVEGDGETFVVLPVGDARRDHPGFLLLVGGFPRGTAKDGWRWTRRAARDLLVLETGRFQRIFDDVCHLDDPLF